MITNNTMENRQKKEYTAPKMEIIEYKRESELLCSSSDRSDCEDTIPVEGW